MNAAAQVERATVDGAAAALLLLHSARMILTEVLAARPSLGLGVLSFPYKNTPSRKNPATLGIPAET